MTDQQALSGFAARPGDVERLASLGASRVRFPLLWERAETDRAWADTALSQFRQFGVKLVLGLVHHGGGPLSGGILDPGFAKGLADYAAAVARRFPWIDAYTPVNEPLTTARFSGLYGVWHPHAAADRTFVRGLLNQLNGTVLSMQAIRQVNPDAALIQTEDMGRMYGTPILAEQVEFENLRRWLSFDLLCGRVDEGHALWNYLIWAGAVPRELLWFAEHPCAPTMLGLNIYPTSERYLDERLERYPACFHGGNGRVAYADVEAVRVRAGLPGIFFQRLMEAHRRYGLPLALTEVHLGCTRDEQLRWLNAGWRDSLRAMWEGADVRAVTAWSALGSFEWNSLMTRQEGYYEPGLWDVSGDEPRETALAGLARELAAGGRPGHPVIAGPGWWERAERRHWPDDQPTRSSAVRGRPIEICPGPLAAMLETLCLRRGLPFGTSINGAGPPWAKLEANTTGTLKLHWLGRGSLSVQAAALGTTHLDAALDLLIDGEAGHWLWNGRRFVHMDMNVQQRDTVAAPHFPALRAALTLPCESAMPGGRHSAGWET